MKLSAPPPPPPPPPEPPAPGEQPDANSLTTPASEHPEPPPAPPGPRPLTWPAWYAGVDAALAGLVLVFAFAAASFVARNSDVWLHLAAGKRLFAGQYTPGSDPFSYSASSRAWVNHSWLTDGVAYLLYGGEGKVLVIAKALVIALTFGLLIAIRRPQFPLWPWAVVTCVAVLAAAPYFTLRPQVVSMLSLALTLFLLFRMPRKPNSWQFPGAIGVTFWLWSNSDPWFFVGPMALALIIAGDLIQTKLLNSPDEPASGSDEEPLGQLPDTLTLAKALGVGVLACMLNPHHVRVWELPFELVGATGAEIDPRLRQLFLAPIDSDYMNSPALGENANGVAYAVLFLVGAAILGLGYGRLRVAHVALWIGFAALSLLSVYAIPFFAIVAVPLVAAQLNAFGARTVLKTWDDPKSKFLLLGSTVGRLLCVLAVCGLCVVAYPGWVQPESPNPAYARRVAWSVEADPALKRAAEQFKQWRGTGKLPADAHGVIVNTDLANYVAWFAPQEKVFFNSRYNHHRRELPDYLALRKTLGLIEVKDYRPSTKEAAEVLARLGAEYVAIYAGSNDSPTVRGRASETASVLFRQWEEWSPWYLDGRTTVFGWRAADTAARPTFAGLRVDPQVLAFGPEVKRVPEPELMPPPPALGWEEAFVRPARPAPVGGAEAIAWVRYKDAMVARQVSRQFVREALSAPWFSNTPGTTDLTMHRFAVIAAGVNGALRFAPNDATDPTAAADTRAIQAAPLLALRAARRAIAEDPDHPDPYYALALALRDQNLPLSVSERSLGMVVAYRQCLDRLPPPDRYKKGQYGANATEAALALTELYLGRPVNTKVLVIRRPGKQPPVRILLPRTARDVPPKGPDEQHEVVDVGTRYTGLPIDIPGLRELLGDMIVIRFDKASGRPVSDRVPFGPYNPNDPTVVLLDGPTLLPLDIARETLQLAIQYAPTDWGGETPAEETKRRLKALDGFLKEVETEVVRADDRYSQAKAAGQKLSDLVRIARYVGLTGKSLDLLNDKDTDLPKEFNELRPQAELVRIALELVLRRVENANELLAGLSTPEWAATLELNKLTRAAQLLQYQKALQAGEYKTAGDLWVAMEGTRIGALDKLGPAGPTLDKQVILPALAAGYQNPEPEKVLAGLLRPPILLPGHPLTKALLLQTEFSTRSPEAVSKTRYQPIDLGLWVADWIELQKVLQQQVLSQMQYEVNFFYRRGVLSLLEGDIPAAKQRFQQAASRKPPSGWGHDFVTHVEARQFLQLIEAAEKKAAAP